MFRRTAFATLTSLALATASLAASAADQVFTNAASITISDNTAASPSPSTIAVSDLSGNVEGVTVTLHGISHTWIGDLSVVVVSPSGQKVALMQRVGVALDAGCCGNSSDWINDEITFSATAATQIPASGAVPSGSYRPSIGNSNWVLAAPAPAGPYSASMTVLEGSGASQTGSWQLFVDDGSAGDLGSIANGWSITFSGANLNLNTTTCASEGYRGAQLTWCKNICENGLSGQVLDTWIHRWINRYRDLPYCAVESPSNPA